jgi:hypothetical protein
MSIVDTYDDVPRNEAEAMIAFAREHGIRVEYTDAPTAVSCSQAFYPETAEQLEALRLYRAEWRDTTQSS